MPGQIHGGQIGPHAFIQNAFQIGFDIFIILSRLCPVKEIGGRQLFRVTDHHHLFATGNGPDGIPYGDLGGLIKHHHIELSGFGGQKLCNRQRTHQQARAEFAQHFWRAPDEFPQWHVLPFLVHLMPQNAPFGIAGDIFLGRKACTERSPHPIAGEFYKTFVECAEVSNPLFVLGRHECPDHRLRVNRRIQPPAAVVDFECLAKIRRRNAS